MARLADSEFPQDSKYALSFVTDTMRRTPKSCKSKKDVTPLVLPNVEIKPLPSCSNQYRAVTYISMQNCQLFATQKVAENTTTREALEFRRKCCKERGFNSS